MDILEFKEALSDLGIDVTSDDLFKLNRYYELLIEWNEKINLTAITLRKQVYLKHFYDSLTLVKCIDLNKCESLCDLGTGAGFPGIVLKIFFPHLKLTLVDALNKRIKFLKVVMDELGLEDVSLVHARAEEYARENREVFDVVTARAVASIPILLEYGIPLVKVNGYLCAMRGNDDSSGCENALDKLNCKLDKIVSFKLPIEDSNRTLIKFIKCGKTNMKYPRKYADMKKKTL